MYKHINMRVYTLAARLFSSACCSLCNIHAPFSEDVSLHYSAVDSVTAEFTGYIACDERTYKLNMCYAHKYEMLISLFAES
jgi:hypothetical protein